jgi:hypothetical protein
MLCTVMYGKIYCWLICVDWEWKQHELYALEFQQLVVSQSFFSWKCSQPDNLYCF